MWQSYKHGRVPDMLKLHIVVNMAEHALAELGIYLGF